MAGTLLFLAQDLWQGGAARAASSVSVSVSTTQACVGLALPLGSYNSFGGLCLGDLPKVGRAMPGQRARVPSRGAGSAQSAQAL